MSKTNRWRFLMSALAVAVYMACVDLRSYPQQIALLMSFSTVALAYSVRRTFYELRRIFRAEAGWEKADLPDVRAAEDRSPEDRSPEDLSPETMPPRADLGP